MNSALFLIMRPLSSIEWRTSHSVCFCNMRTSIILTKGAWQMTKMTSMGVCQLKGREEDLVKWLGIRRHSITSAAITNKCLVVIQNIVALMRARNMIILHWKPKCAKATIKISNQYPQIRIKAILKESKSLIISLRLNY